MDIKQMENILYNLTNLEFSFKELSPNVNYNDYQTYHNFLEHFFIKKNDLQNIYWKKIPQNSALRQPRNLQNYTRLEEDLLFFRENIVLMKQPNLPFNHMLANNFFQCIYVMDGCAALHLENETKQLSTDDFLLMYPGVTHLLNAADGSVTINIFVKKKHLYSGQLHILGGRPNPNFSVSAPRQTPADVQNPDGLTYFLFHTSENPDVKDTVLRMFIEYLQQLNYKDQVLDSHLTLLFAYLSRHQQGEIEFSTPLTATQKAFDQILRYCQQNTNQATLSDASKKLNYSKQYIGRIVKEMTGNTFTTMVNDLRLETVKNYLSDSQMTLNNIAEICGFSDASHLSRIFKKQIGISPSVYRDRHRNQAD